uniref:Uncharacterized protein n=1 Tax=Melittangium boletus TaxID=83453 RepID=A0A3S7UWT8_9BACT|nr:hypothetical protein [Melittangium boletus]
MNPRSSSSTLLLSLALLLVPARQASAAQSTDPTALLALHPCVVVGEKDQDKVRDYQLACTTTVARDDVRLVPSEQVLAVLDKEPKKSCAPPASKKPSECLGRLASATQAARSVLITITPGQVTRVSGLVVSAQGDVIDQKNIQLRNRGQSQDELVRTALSRLRGQLDLVPAKQPPVAEAPTPASPPPAPPPVVTVTPPPETAPEKEKQSASTALEPIPTTTQRRSPLLGQSWKTPVAYSAAGLGVVAFGVAGFLAISGDQAMRQSNTYFADGSYPVISDLDTVIGLREQASSKRTLAGISTAVGAVLVGTGVYMWLDDRPTSPKPGITAVSVGPGSVSLFGVLP